MKRLAVVVTMFAVSGPLASAEVMPVSEAAFVELLIGCWSAQGSDVCFYEDGVVSSAVFRLDTDGMLYGGGGGGVWSVRNQKLILNSETDFWAFPLTSMVCDAVVQPGVSLQLSGCFGSDPEVAAGGTPISVQLHSVDATIADIRSRRP